MDNTITNLLQSKAWKKVDDHLIKERDYLLNKLTNCPLEEIGFTRGQIEAIKKLDVTLRLWEKEEKLNN